MDKPTFTPQGRDIDVLKGMTRRTGVADRRAKPEGKRTGKDRTPSWESAFHAERGCLDGGLPLRFSGPVPRH